MVMTPKFAPCLARTRPLPPAVEASRTTEDGSRKHAALAPLVRQPWLLRVGTSNLVIRGADARDLQPVAGLHARSSAQSRLDRYRLGGRGPSVLAMQRMLRRPLAFVAATRDGAVVALAVAAIDARHSPTSAEVGLIIEDRWQGLGVGRELTTHLAAAAAVCGYTDLIAYTATSVLPAQRLLLAVGTTRVVADVEHPHLHTSLPESAALGLGAVRERLAS